MTAKTEGETRAPGQKKETRARESHGTEGEPPAGDEKPAAGGEQPADNGESAAGGPSPAFSSTPPDTRPIPESVDGDHDLDDPAYYLNRELTWLNFNFRVLAEAEGEDTPLLERVKFLSIVSSNLDEFFMKRIGGLKQQVGAGVLDRSVDGRAPQEQIDDSSALVAQLEERKHAVFRDVMRRLGDHGIEIATYDGISDADRAYLREYYIANVYPLVTPQSTDPAHPFPFISNLSLNLLVTVRLPGAEEASLARVKVPVGAGTNRFLKLPDRNTFVPLETVIRENLDLLFPGMEIDRCEVFRVTRNANTEQDEESAEDLLAMIESELRERKLAPTVRIEVESDIMPLHQGMLCAELGLNEETDVFEVTGLIGMRDIMELLSVSGMPELRDPAHHPVDNAELVTPGSIFHTIRDAGSILLQHPYESFGTSVERFLMEASQDPKVRAIKMTLYRTSDETKALGYLMDAARNGKQVAVVMELKARFDEAANIRWAAKLEQVGIHVTYGVVGLKTHCKAVLVVRQDFGGITRYAHLGTGNYHAGTARLYSDVGLLTNDQEVGEDLTELFNYLTTGYKPKRVYNKLLPAPKVLKRALLQKIQREIDGHSEESPGRIIFKMNALEDQSIVRALYRASQAGVRVDLIVRDTCRIRPGIEGLSDNVRVVGIVGRFLEHSRIYYFHNGGDEEFYLGSADCMKRNLDSRVELFVPIEKSGQQAELLAMLEAQLADTRGAWLMRADGSFSHALQADGKRVDSQARSIERAEKRFKDATRLKRRKAHGLRRGANGEERRR